jgi:hypothetical protein
MGLWTVFATTAKMPESRSPQANSAGVHPEVPTTDRRSADEAAKDALVDLGRALLLTGEGTDDDKSTGDGGYCPLQHGQLPLG